MSTRIVVATAAALALLGAAPAVAAPTASDDATATYIVQFTPGADHGQQVAQAKALGLTVVAEYTYALNGMAVEANAGQLTALQRNPNVLLVEASQTATVDDTTQTGATWGIDRIDQRSLPLSTTYTYSTNASNVTAYVIDTGIRADHTEFGGRVDTAAGFDAMKDGNGVNDCHGHGTHVAGTIGGSTYGVAKGVKLVPIRVLGCDGSGSDVGILAAIDHVIKNHVSGPAVANMSLGFNAIVTSVDTAVDNLVKDGVTVAVAAGNSNKNACNDTPARVPSAITVGATTSSDARAYYSNYGTCLDLFAPGSSITSAWYTSTTATNTISGTSMASPHAAGAAALYLADHAAALPATVAAALTTNATSGKVTSPGTGSPNLLLFTGTTVIPPAPTITSLSPDAGPVGTEVTITGTNLTGATAVTFGGQAAAFTVTSATSIATSVPSGAATGTVNVTTLGGTVTGPQFTVTSPTVTPPVVTSVTATPGVARASVTWTVNAGGGTISGSTVKAFEVRRGVRTLVATVPVAGSASSTTITGLKSRTSYTFTVTSANEAGTGAESAPSNTIKTK